MGERAYINIIENGKSNIFYGHWAANNLTTIYSYAEAQIIQSEKHPKKSITDIMANFDYDRVYNPNLKDSDKVFQIFDEDEYRYFKRPITNFPPTIAMKITLDLDKQSITHARRDSYVYTMPIPRASEIMQDAFNESERRGIDEFWQIEKIYTSKIPQINEICNLYKAANILDNSANYEEDEEIEP